MSEEQPAVGPNAPQAEEAAIELDPIRVQEFRRRIETEQNILLAVLGGAVAALVGAAIWAAITVVTHYQIGFMAIGVGLLVGLTVRFLGKGITTTFGVVGAVFSLVGCLLGNLFSACGFLAAEKSVSFWEVVGDLNPELIAALMKATFSAIDLLFYGIAVYEGYKIAFRRVTAEELQSLVRSGPSGG
jgi:hypothetical protein